MRRLLVASLATAGIALVAASATAAPTLNTKLCGQIRHGPYLKWTLAIPGQAPITLKGTTWTVFSTGGVPCSTAMTIGRVLLAKLPASLKTPTHLIKPTPAGFSICSSEPKNGNVSCYDLKHNRNVTAWETDPFTLAQVKQFAATGKLPGR